MTLWIPPSALAKDGFKFRCLSCGIESADTDHVIECSRSHEDIEQAMSPRNDRSVFNGQKVDVELETWVEQHRKELLEKRKKL